MVNILLRLILPIIEPMVVRLLHNWVQSVSGNQDQAEKALEIIVSAKTAKTLEETARVSKALFDHFAHPTQS